MSRPEHSEHSEHGERARAPERAEPVAFVPLPAGAPRAAAAARLAAQLGTDAATVWLAAWGILLHQLGGQSELVVGEQRGGQLVPLQLRFDGGADFAHHVGELVAARDASRRRHGHAAPTAAEPFDTWFGHHGASRSGLSLLPGGEASDLQLAYATASHTEDSARRHGHCLLILFDRLVACPATAIAELDGLDDAQRDQLLGEFAGSTGDYPRDARIEALVARHVEHTPAQIAVRHSAGTLSYRELWQRSEALADDLRRHGLRSGEPVALLLPREPSMVVATLAVLRAGGVYVPIDPEYPAARIDYVLEDSGARRLLVTAEQDVAHAADVLWRLDRRGTVVEIAASSSSRTSQAEPQRVPAASPDAAGQTAYLMYTSGTTGQPKGVPVPHRGVVRLVCTTDYVSLDASTVMLQAGAIGFDAATWEIWGALLNGGTLCIADRATLVDTAELRRFLRAHGVNTALLTPSLFAQHADQDPALFAEMDQLLVGGDVFPSRQARLVRQACPELRLINAYGPTENAVISTAHTVSDREPTPIGRPIRHSTAFILNRYQRPQPIGVVGELYVGGDGLGPGYLRSAELTARAFVPHPFRPGEVLYRTGDHARWCADGEIEFCGRRDHQVKIRGHRIDPSEIEARLAAHPEVSECVVVVAERAGAPAALVAYVSGPGSSSGSGPGSGGLTPGALRQWLAEALPAHMIPAYFVRLPRLPLTTHGKIDRRALPAPTPANAASAVDELAAPRDPIEATIVELAATALGLERVSTGARWLAMGGDSLTGAVLAQQITRALGVRCPAGALLSATSFAALAAELRSAPASGAGILPAPRRASYRASPQQRRVYVEQAKDPQATHYNLPLVVELPERLSFPRLAEALRELVARHSALTTELTVLDAEVVQRLRPDTRLPFVELEAEMEAKTGEHEASDLTRFVRPFDLGAAPLWRAALVHTSRGSRLLFDIHHIITDGLSLAQLFTEWQALYRGESLAPVDLQHVDFSEWVNGPEGEQLRARQRGFWVDVLSPPAPRLALPSDFLRPGLRSTVGGSITFDLGGARAAALRARAGELRCTSFHWLAAAYALWLSRATGAHDVVVGTPAHGRSALGSERIHGMLVNTTCLRLTLRPELSVAEWVALVAARSLAAFDHQDYPFDELVRELAPQRDHGRNPLFDTMFALQNAGPSGMAFLGGQVTWTPAATGQTLFDLNLQIEEQAGAFVATWSYARDLFLASTVESFANQFLNVLDEMARDPGRRLASLLEDARVAPTLPEITFDF